MVEWRSSSDWHPIVLVHDDQGEQEQRDADGEKNASGAGRPGDEALKATLLATIHAVVVHRMRGLALLAARARRRAREGRCEVLNDTSERAFVDCTFRRSGKCAFYADWRVSYSR